MPFKCTFKSLLAMVLKLIFSAFRLNVCLPLFIHAKAKLTGVFLFESSNPYSAKTIH